jgi:GT2 family glycosyltransferase
MKQSLSHPNGAETRPAVERVRAHRNNPARALVLESGRSRNTSNGSDNGPRALDLRSKSTRLFSPRPARVQRKDSVSIIIPVFNQQALTRQCLEALSASVDDDVEIVVVNDASTDTTSRFLAGKRDKIRVVTHATNSGFAKSCNDGAAASSGNFLLFLNNDTIPQPGWLGALRGYVQAHPAAAVVGSKLLYPNRTIQHAGVVICQDRYPRHVYAGFPADHPAVNKSRRFQIVTAACMFVRRRIFEQASGFDTAFRNGFEDVDFCLRLGEAGYEIHYCSESVVQHMESISAGRFKNDRENVALYRRRWMPRVQPDDMNYYLEDGLLALSYEGSYPVRLQVSPSLALLDGDSRSSEAERLLARHSRQVTDLTRENTRLLVELGRRAPDSAVFQYDQLRRQILAAVRGRVPATAHVAVVSKGDSALLELEGPRACHFPQSASGAYAGHHPADSADAIEQLENLRTNGTDYLLFPSTSLWWLEHYAGFREHLESKYQQVMRDDNVCRIYQLNARSECAGEPERAAMLARPTQAQERL